MKKIAIGSIIRIVSLAAALTVLRQMYGIDIVGGTTVILVCFAWGIAAIFECYK